MSKIPVRHYRHPDGTTYRVGKGGAWIRETLRRCEARDRKDTHNNAVRRRMAKEA